MALNARQARFVEEYLIDLNATQAAIRAGYSAKTAAEQASRLLTIVKIREAVAAGQAKRSESVEITQEMVLRGLLVEAKGEGPDTSSAARNAAWKLVGQHIGMFADKNPLLNLLTLDDLVMEAARARAERDKAKGNGAAEVRH